MRDPALRRHKYVHRRHRRPADTFDDCAEYVTVTDELIYSSDAWHYDTGSFMRLGTAFAEAMSELELQCGQSDNSL